MPWKVLKCVEPEPPEYWYEVKSDAVEVLDKNLVSAWALDDDVALAGAEIDERFRNVKGPATLSACGLRQERSFGVVRRNRMMSNVDYSHGGAMGSGRGRLSSGLLRNFRFLTRRDVLAKQQTFLAAFGKFVPILRDRLPRNR